MEAPKTDKIHNTVILTDRFAERRAQPASAAGQPADDEPLQPLKAGERIDRYVILHALGGGGMGLVYKALDTELTRVVALKVLPPQLSRHPDYLSRFRAEARAQARLNSPHVVTLYSLLELADGEVLVLEYLEGQTLAQRLLTQGPLPVDLAVDIFGQALVGLAHIHGKGVIHRDLKPSNIFLTQDGQVKLMDFGVAKRVDQPDDPSQPRAMVGTLLYISPEQINGRETDFRSDIYTLGVSLFESVTGRLPFERRTDYALMHAHVQENPPRPKQFQRRLPAELEWVILKALEKDPERRFRDAAEFRASLHQVAPGNRYMPARTDIAAPRNELMRHRFTRKNRLLGSFGFDILLIGAVIVLLFGLGVSPFKSRTTPPAEAKNAAPTRLAPWHAPAAKTPPLAKSPAAKPRNTVPAPKPAAKSRFDSLRDAWGG